MRRLLLIFLFLNACWAFADGDLFEQGLKEYQTKNWDAARSDFEKALEQHPNDAAIFYNLGLAYFQLGKKGYAVGYWRKALAIAPGLPAAREALTRADEKFHLSHLEKSPWALSVHETSTAIGWNLALLALAILIAACGWLWLSFAKRRKTALLSEDGETPTPSWSLLALTFLFLIVAGANIAKWLDSQTERATVVASAELMSAPAEGGVSIASVPEASEVSVLTHHDDWVQVDTGDGTSGWLKNSDVILSSREKGK